MKMNQCAKSAGKKCRLKVGTPQIYMLTFGKVTFTAYLVKEMVSFKTLEKPSFKTLLMTLDQPYIPPKQKYFSQTATPKLYNKMRKEVQVLISECNHIALTTDVVK